MIFELVLAVLSHIVSLLSTTSQHMHRLPAVDCLATSYTSSSTYIPIVFQLQTPFHLVLHLLPQVEGLLPLMLL